MLPQKLQELTSEITKKYVVLPHDPEVVREKAKKEIDAFLGGVIDPQSFLFKAMTLNEFENGYLLTSVMPEHYRTFAVDFSRQLQKEYDCKTVSEKALCEYAALSYVRTLEAQRSINFVLAQKTVDKIANEFIAVMSKEIDRSSRQFSSALQNLRLMKQVPLKVTVKAQTAIIGQNQAIQTNNIHE